ncbi:MAG TPA: DUF3298 domain-containing protein [Pyrinomonadaceae bacterium]|nr:DUF3298 domain-containing protein [Pyrinomonadaceae bacterium]
MKQFSIFLFLIAIFTLTSCKKATTNPPQPSNQSASPPAAEQLAHSEAGVTASVEIKYLKGSIGSALGLQMRLAREGEKLSGSYFYQKSGTRIDLKGTIDKDNYVTLEEFDASGKQTGVFTGLWTMEPEVGVSIAGNWSRPDGQKKTAFSLHEEPIHFSGAAEMISKTIKESNKKLNYEIDAEYPQLTGLLSPGFEKFNQEASRLALREVNGFRKNLSEASSETSESSSRSTLDIGYTVALATDDLISIQFDVGTYYSGAAHPNSNSRVFNFDVKKVRTLKLGDLFKPGAKYLQALSSYSVKDLKRQSTAKGADGMLDDASIESGAGATAKNYENWTITKKGLGIIFDAYQVGPYAAGPQYVLVPYSALKEMIDPTGPVGMYL